MAWTKLKYSDNELLEIYNTGALSYCQQRDFDRFAKWAAHNGITHYTIPNVYYEDIPKLLNTGRTTFGFPNNIPNPGKSAEDVADGFDHPRVYKNVNTGECWLICHIYNNTYNTIRQLAAWCSDTRRFMSPEATNLIAQLRAWTS